MNIYRNLFYVCSVAGAIVLSACDLQPKIASIPDSIGDFISTRYPALLADPVTQPEIYNSAVTDYGVYASPELYGSDKDYLVYANIDDYVAPAMPDTDAGQINTQPIVQSEISSGDDYLVVPNYEKPIVKSQDSDFVIVARGDTLYSIARSHDTTVAELAKINSLKEPYTLSIGQKVMLRTAFAQKSQIEPAKSVAVQSKIPAEGKVIAKNESVNPAVVKAPPAKQTAPKIANVTRVAVQEITVAPGDTLYSLSRKYEIPVNDLAVMNKISSPFTLSVGQKLKVPKFNNVETKSVKNSTKAEAVVQNKKVDDNKVVQKRETSKTKISSDPKKQLPTISARSNTKFSWPMRGKILSQYGAKNGGLFNDGINIAGNLGASVKAAENGVVAYAGNEVKGMGNLIIMQHSDGWMTIYAHLNSMSVRRGSKVSVGQQIGTVGKTGKVDSPQLHFEIRKGTKAYNPITYLKK